MFFKESYWLKNCNEDDMKLFHYHHGWCIRLNRLRGFALAFSSLSRFTFTFLNIALKDIFLFLLGTSTYKLKGIVYYDVLSRFALFCLYVYYTACAGVFNVGPILEMNQWYLGVLTFSFFENYRFVKKTTTKNENKTIFF